jgi:hypothetical protein
VAFDSAGNLYASEYDATGIDVFTPPFSNASVPAFTIPTPEPVQCLQFNGTHLWTWDFTPEISDFAPPFSASSTPVFNITNGLQDFETCIGFGA